MAGVEGLEPPTHGLEIRCSILLSYTPKFLIYKLLTANLIYSKPWFDDADNERAGAVFRFRKRVW